MGEENERNVWEPTSSRENFVKLIFDDEANPRGVDVQDGCDHRVKAVDHRSKPDGRAVRVATRCVICGEPTDEVDLPELGGINSHRDVGTIIRYSQRTDLERERDRAWRRYGNSLKAKRKLMTKLDEIIEEK